MLATSIHLRSLLRLALPVVLVQVGMMLMGVVDTIMVGHLSATALAAVALGNLYFFGVAIFGMGTLMALDPVVAQGVGANDQEAVSRGVQRGGLLAVLLALPAAALLLPAEPVLRWLSQPADVVPVAGAYTRVSVFGILGLLGFVVLRQSLQAMGRMRPIVLAVVGANLANLVLNWMLIFGRLGAPALGPVGAAWATVASRWLMALGLLVLAWRELRPHLAPFRPEVLSRKPLIRMLKLGAPIGLQHQLEYGVFGLIGLFMGWFGTREMAGHQVALNLASLSFMVPLGISGAAGVRVGQAVGAYRADDARGAARAALTVGVLFMSGTCVLFLALPGLLARLYTSVPDVAAIAVTLIPIAGVFQVFDGIQVVSIGILRGLGDTRTPMVINVLGFWLLGLPVSLYLGFHAGLGPVGLWWGLTVGLIIVATALLTRVRARLLRDLKRIVIDAPAEVRSALP